jgi:parallel beta-helix repeat protein
VNLKILRARSLVAVLAVLVVAVSGALPLTQAAACPAQGVPITTSWRLSSDCTYSTAGENGIVLGASGITLDCEGHTITFTPTGSPAAIVVGKGYTGDTIQNCLVSSSANYGIFAYFVSGLTLTRNSATSAVYAFYFVYVSNVVLTGNTASGSTEGFYCYEYCYNMVFTGNTAQGNGDGFSFHSAVGGTLTSNKATGNSGDGFFFDSASGQFTLKSNKADSNSYGYYDDTTGAGTIALGNTYINNECSLNTSHGAYDETAGIYPAAMCLPTPS